MLFDKPIEQFKYDDSPREEHKTRLEQAIAAAKTKDFNKAIGLGSKVALHVGGKEKLYEHLPPQEMLEFLKKAHWKLRPEAFYKYTQNKDNLDKMSPQEAARFALEASKLHPQISQSVSGGSAVDLRNLIGTNNNAQDSYKQKITELKGADKFWRGYESGASPRDFATWRMAATGNSKTYPHYSGDRANPDNKWLAEGGKGALDAHASSSQHALLDYLTSHDEHPISWKKVKQPSGETKFEPHVTLYRGISGGFAKGILDALKHDKSTNEIDKKNVSVPALPFQSWSLAPHWAQTFGARTEPGKEPTGLVIKKQVPLKDVIHTGFLSHFPGHYHEHPNEMEVVVRHDNEKIHLNDKNIHSVRLPSTNEFNQYEENFQAPKVRPSVKPLKKAEQDHVDRGLVLKLKNVTVKQLKEALKDVHPKIRKLAAQHPALTPELMKEVLAGNDNWLKGVLLQRHDLPEEIKLLETKALDNTNLEHQAFSIAREDVLGNLKKSIGFVTFPHFGVLSPRTSPKSVTPAQIGELYERAFNQKAPTDRRPGSTVVNVSQDKPVPPEERKLIPWVRTGLKSSFARATENHESQHTIFGEIAQKFGNHTRKQLADKLVSQLSDDDQDHLIKVTAKFVPKNAISNEERIAYLHHYLTDPIARNQMHPEFDASRLGHFSEQDIESAKEATKRNNVIKARKIWNNLRSLANRITPAHLSLHTEKSEIALWGEALRKKDEAWQLEHMANQLGIDTALQDYLDAIHLVTGQKIMIAEVRRFVAQSGGDMFQAALKAAGLDSAAEEEAVKRALGFVQLHKSEEKVSVQTVSPVTPDADAVAKLIQKAADDGSIEKIDLDGRYSSGALIAREDVTSSVFLLKPESDKKSPAAGMNDNQTPMVYREAAFCRLANQLGLSNDLPDAKLVQLDGKTYIAIEFLGVDYATAEKARQMDPIRVTQAFTPYLRSGQIFKWSALDWIAGDVDRHGNNMMINDEGTVKLIDQGSSFAGEHFSPGQDKDSFIPFYLRIWSSNKNFQELDIKDRLMSMPVADTMTDQRLKNWILSVDESELVERLSALKIDVAPVLKRLKQLKEGAAEHKNFSEFINKLWAS